MSYHHQNEESNPINPKSLDYLINYKDYQFYLKLSKQFDLLDDKESCYLSYQEYKRDYLSRQYFTLFLQQKSKPWFQEKYYDSFKELRNKLRIKGWNNNPNIFFTNLNDGHYDNISYDKPPNSRKKLPQEKYLTLPYTLDPPDNPQIFIKSIPPDLSREKLEDFLSTIPGFDYLAISDPQPAKRFHRTGWINFSMSVDINELLETTLKNPKIDDFTLFLTKTDQPITTKARVAPGVTNSPDRLRQDLSNIRKLTTHLESIYNNLNAQSNDPISISDHINNRIKHLNIADDIQRIKKELDFYILYLRQAFNSCYYSASINDFKEELQRKSSMFYRETDNDYADQSDDRISPQDNWIKNLDEKISIIIDQNLDYTKLGGIDYDKEVSAVANKLVKKEDENKFRCLECTKLFRALEFIEKHILNKHNHAISSDNLVDLQAFNNFLADPHKILPPTDLPASMNRRIPAKQYQQSVQSTSQFTSNKRSYDDHHNSQNKRYKSAGIPAWTQSVPQHTLPPSYREAPLNNFKSQPSQASNLPKPPPPPGAKLDPRAQSNNTYEDLDTVAGGDDVELQY